MLNGKLLSLPRNGGLVGLAQGETERSKEALETLASSWQITQVSYWKYMQKECLFCSWWLTSWLSKHHITPAGTEQMMWLGSSGEDWDL